MSKPREFWVVAYRSERMSQYFIRPELSELEIEKLMNKGRTVLRVIEKSAADKLAEALELVIKEYGSTVAIMALKEYRGEK